MKSSVRTKKAPGGNRELRSFKRENSRVRVAGIGCERLGNREDDLERGHVSVREKVVRASERVADSADSRLPLADNSELKTDD